jgi:hypothetical protein
MFNKSPQNLTPKWGLFGGSFLQANHEAPMTLTVTHELKTEVPLKQPIVFLKSVDKYSDTLLQQAEQNATLSLI